MWTEKYRPKSLKEYVFKDARQKELLEGWVKAGVLPTLLVTGQPGTGKTTVAKVLLNELGVNEFDIKEINASRDNGVDFIRDSVTRFVETMGYGPMKYVLMDEFDYASVNAQAVLRNTIEKYAGSVRFIFTANYPDKIIPAIKSRCEAGRMHIDKLDRDEFTLRLCNILIAENIAFEMDTVDAIVSGTYPDMRRGISQLQVNSISGTLALPADASETVADYKIDMIALFRAKKYRDARTLICEQVQQEEYEDLYRFMYKNLEIWADGNTTKEDMAIIAIRDGLVNHTMCADSELNLSATLIELENIATLPV